MGTWIEGRVAERFDWTEQHFSLRIACDHPGFAAGQFVRVGLPDGDDVLARPYSCVNAPHQDGIEIFLNRVPDGPLSNRLADLNVGDSLLINPTANGFLTLEEIPASASDLWMIATGTGVGPFLSILQSEETWERFAHVSLVYGVREASHLAYPGLIDKLDNQYRKLKVLPCISRNPHDNAFHGRVTEALRSGHLEQHCQRQLDPEHSHVLLCGRKDMIVEMSELLLERGLRKHLRKEPGQVSSEKYH